MTWNIYQVFARGPGGGALNSPTVTVTLSATGALATLASTISGTALANPFTGTSEGLARFYVQAGRYNITLTKNSNTFTFYDVLIGSASGADIGTAADNVPTIEIGDARYGVKPLNKYDAVDPPAATDDSSLGYSQGSLWVDISVSPRETFLCIDSAASAAVWVSVNLTIGDLGSIVSQNANAVTITGGSITGITDLAIADGGTGASTAADARTNLGLGTAAVANSADFATAAQGALADTASQPGQNISQFVNDMGYIAASPVPITVTGNITADSTWGGKPVFVTDAAVITLPQASTYNAPAGFTFDVLRNTTGAVTFAIEGSDVIIATVGGPLVGITDQYGWCSVMKISAGVWSIVGQIQDTTP